MSDDSQNGSTDAGASPAERLFPVVYDQLRSLARRHMRAERGDHTLEPTALVHEAYLRLASQVDADIRGRTQFVAVASSAMRRVLIDHARARAAAKRGGGRTLLTLRPGMGSEGSRNVDLLALDEALEGLAAVDPRQARLVEMRFFGGLEIEEAAEALGISRSTAIRDWRRARAWLARALGPLEPDDPRGGDSPR